MKSTVNTRICLILVAGGALAVALVPIESSAGIEGPPVQGQPGHATAADRSSYLTAWRAAYPDSTIPQRMVALTGDSCLTCHNGSKRDPATCYKRDLETELNNGLSIQDALVAVEGMDSDGDGVSNIDEILMVRLDDPSQRGYHPGLIGPTGTDPCAQNPNAAVTNQLETPPCYADCDPNGVLDIFDFLCFQNSFVAGEPYACDCDPDPACNVFDFLCFQNAFVAGCP